MARQPKRKAGNTPADARKEASRAASASEDPGEEPIGAPSADPGPVEDSAPDASSAGDDGVSVSEEASSGTSAPVGEVSAPGMTEDEIFVKQVMDMQNIIYDLDPDDEELWEGGMGGPPFIEVLEELYGHPVSPRVRDTAWSMFRGDRVNLPYTGPAESANVILPGDKEPTEIHRKDMVKLGSQVVAQEKFDIWRHTPTGIKFFTATAFTKSQGVPIFPF